MLSVNPEKVSVSQTHANNPQSKLSSVPLLPAFSLVSQDNSPNTHNEPERQNIPDPDGREEITLVQQFDVEGAAAEEILGFDDDDDDGDEDQDDDGEDFIAEDECVSDSPRAFREYQASVRVAAAKRAEGNRRSGGLKTQKAMVRSWEVSIRFF